MPFLRRSPRAHAGTTTTHRTTKPSILSRLTGTTRPAHTTPRSTHTTRSRRTAAPVRTTRRPTMTDKISGTLMRMKGMLMGGGGGIGGTGTTRTRGTTVGRHGRRRAPVGVTARPVRRKRGLF